MSRRPRAQSPSTTERDARDTLTTRVTSSEFEPRLVEEPLWFGPNERPLFGWLTWPTDANVRGGVLLAPSIGKESVAERLALGAVARTMSQRGFVTLRFDYDGTGDSAGDFDDDARDRAWMDSVATATRYLRSLGLDSVSALGIRLGATILGEAAATRNLGLTSMILWDPCESGRGYLRELSALEALRREGYELKPDGSVETSEFLFSSRMVAELRHLRLSELRAGSLASRVLVMARSDRSLSDKFRARFDQEKVTWEVTSEQAIFTDVEPFYAKVPQATVERLVAWLEDEPAALATFVAPSPRRSTVVARPPGRLAVTESVRQLGPEELFAIVSEPEGVVRAPLVVMMNSVNDDHTGRARLWVELSRRWSSFGLRCVRFDLREFGESPWPSGVDEHLLFDRLWIDDVINVVRLLSEGDPANSVIVGLCSGAHVSVEAALELGAKGVCAINPPVSVDYLHYGTIMERSRNPFVRAVGTWMKELASTHQWVAATLAHVYQMVLPKSRSIDVLSKVVNGGSELLVFGSDEDLTPRPRSLLFRSIDLRRLGRATTYDAVFVPGLDHGLHDAAGRLGVVATMDRYVLEQLAGLASEDVATDGLEPS